MSIKQKKNIIFIMPEKTLPVPAINGGAIETLLTHLIEENENHDDYVFHVLMMKDQKDKSKNFNYNNYKNTKFYDYFMNPRKLGVNTFFFKAFREIRMVTKICCSYDRFIIDQIKQIKPDYVIYEGRYNASVKKVEHIVGREKLAFHIHHQILRKDDFSRYFSKALCVSEFVKDDWIKNKKFSKKIDFEVLPNIVDVNHFNKQITFEEKLALRKSLGLSENDFVLVYVGRLVPVKGIEQLIKAFKQITNENIKLLIVGESMFKDSKKTKFTQYLCEMCEGWERRVKFTGFVDNQSLYKYYNIANVHVIPSIWEEAAGLVALESRVVGVPQIVTNSGGLLEYASKDAIVIDKNDDKFVDNLSTAINLSYNNCAKAISDKNVLTRWDFYNIFKHVIEN